MSNNFTNETEHVLRVEETTMPGTLNYNRLNNKPKIEGVTLEGDLTLDEIGIEAHRFEEYVEQAQESATQSAQYASAAEAHKTAAEGSKNAAAQSASSASTSAQSASQSATQAQTYAGNASTSAGNAQTYAGNASTSATQASGYATNASASATSAEDSAEDSEAWAVGQRGGVDVPSTDPTYENNAKYWAEQSEELKDETQAIVDEARADVFEAMDGLHEETTAGSALQLISDKYTENKEPYLFRKSIAGDRELDTLVGGSIAYNQLVQKNAFSTGTNNGVTFTNNGDGSITVNGTATSDANKTIGVGRAIGHVYFLMGCPNGGSASTFSLGITQSTVIRDFGNGCIWKATSNNNTSLAIFVANGVAMSNVVFKPQLIDLTQMFGSSVADYIYALEQATTGAGVAFFRAMFPKDYYPYNAGELMSVKTTAHEMIGFNQWDEVWELGRLDANGNEASATDQIRSKNYIPVLPNEDYYFMCTTTGIQNMYAMFCYYDADKNFISRQESYSPNSSGSAGYRNPQKAPSNARYMRFYLTGNYGVAYKSDICISISSDRNGEYHPYVKHTYPLDNVELRGVPKLVDGEIQYDGDTYESDGTVTRKYGIVDLGTLTWTATTAFTDLSGDTRYYAQCKPNGIYAPQSVHGAFETVYPDVIMSKGTLQNPVAAGLRDWEEYDYTLSNEYTNPFYVMFTTAKTAEQVKTALSGIFLVYRLATPTTETADPFTNPQIVDAYGTERYVDERTIAVPVGHVTKYPDNLRQKLDGLPWDFSSLIAPTEKAYTATRNYTAGSLLIVNNVLYKVTANIANGGAITPNTNVVATTLSEVISAL